MPPKPKPQLTHFLLLPLITPTSRPQFQSSLQRFSAEISAPSAANEAVKIPAKAIRPIGAIHLTIGVMSLLTPERVQAACEFLKNLDLNGMLRAAAASSAASASAGLKVAGKAESAGSQAPPPSSHSEPIPTDADPPPPPPPPPPLTISLSGLSTLRSPTHTSTLHATPLPTPTSTHLHPFALLLRTAFTSASFLLPEPRSLTLHATIVNTIYTRPRRADHTNGKIKNRWGKGSGKFDATDVMERYKGWEWARDVGIERVAICEMGARDVSGEGGEEEGRVVDQVYREVASVGLPGWG